MGLLDSLKQVAVILASPEGSVYPGGFGAGDSRTVYMAPTVNAVPYIFNGANYDRERCAHAVSILGSAARTADVGGTTQLLMPNLRGARYHIYVTAIASVPSIVANVQVSDTLSTWNTILQSAAITGTGPTELVVYPGCVAVANKVLNEPLARSFRIWMDHSNADPITYSVSCDLLP